MSSCRAVGNLFDGGQNLPPLVGIGLKAQSLGCDHSTAVVPITPVDASLEMTKSGKPAEAKKNARA